MLLESCQERRGWAALRFNDGLAPERQSLPAGILLVSLAKSAPRDAQELVICLAAGDGLNSQFNAGEPWCLHSPLHIGHGGTSRRTILRDPAEPGLPRI